MKNEGHKWLWGRIIIIIRSFFYRATRAFLTIERGAKCQSLKSQMKSWSTTAAAILWKKSFPIVPIGYLAVDLGIKWEAFTAGEATEKKSQAWTFVVSSSWWTILLISQQIFTRGTNTNQLKSFALYVHWKDEASNATDSEAASFFSLRRSLVFYSKALQFLGEALHHNLLQIAWLSFCLKRSNIDKVKWIKKPAS